MTKTLAKKYLSAIKASKKKHLTCEALGRQMGIYPDVIREQLSFFEPLITMDMDYDTHDAIAAIEEYLESLEEKKENVERVIIRKEKIIDCDNCLALESPDLSAPYKTGIPVFYGFNTIYKVV